MDSAEEKATYDLEARPVQQDEATEYPLGARKAWLTLLGSFLLQLCAVGIIMAFGVFQEYYTVDWLSKYTPSDISWIGSVQLFLELGLGVVSGKLCDLGYPRTTILAGSVTFTFSFFMLSITRYQQYYQVFLSQGVGMGLGVAMIYVPTCTIVSNHFIKHKSLSIGILTASAPLGGVIFSIMLNQLRGMSAGFQWGVRAAAFLVLGCMTIGNLIISVPPRPVPSSSSTSSDGKEGDNALQKTSRQNRHSFYQYGPYAIVLITGFILQLGAFFPSFYLQLFATSHSISKELAFYSLAIFNVSNLIGRVLAGHIADRFGALNTYAICLAVNGMVSFAMLGSGTTAGIVLFAIFYGFIVGPTISLFVPVVLEVAPTALGMGKIIGLAIGPGGLGVLVSQPIAGAIIGRDLVWWRGIVFASMSLLVASALLFAAKIVVARGRRIEVQKVVDK